MRLTIVLIAYDGDRWLPDCLRTLRKASGQRLHLVLVDNAHNTIIDELDLTAYDAEVLATPRPMGFAEANNFALVNASRVHERVLFLNQDTISTPGWIDICSRTLSERSELAAVSPLIRTYDDDGWDPSFLACLTADQLDRLERPEEEKIYQVDNVPAAALLMRTSVLASIGPFDPIFGSYYEDYDLCRRIRAHGSTVGFCEDARIRHFSGSATNDEERERKRTRQVIRNRAILGMRESLQPRWQSMARLIFRDFPLRLLRGIVGTPSSQPPGVTLRAFGDIARMWRRLRTEAKDEGCWDQYLRDIDWPPSNISHRSTTNLH